MRRYICISVTSDGVISLWDNPNQRSNGAQDGESFVNMPLTEVQLQMLEQAAKTAIVDVHGNRQI